MTRAVWLALLVSACSTASPSANVEPSLAAAERAPTSVRRLSTAELSAAASALTGVPVELTGQLPPDARQHDFSRNIGQSVDPLTLQQLEATGRELARALVLSAPAFPACSELAAAGDEPCRDEVVQQLAERGFRRRPSVEELAGLQQLFEVGAAEGSFRGGAELVFRAVLGAPSLVYDTSLGGTDGALSDDELGSQLAWLTSGAPPDRELRRAAQAGELRSGAERRKQAERLAAAASSRPLYRRFVEEWLGLNRLRGLAKSSDVVADFAALRGAMLRETEAVVDDVFASSAGSLEALFAGGYSLVPDELAELYGITPTGGSQRTNLTAMGRVGLLQQASFLATFAHEAESAPVLRGKAVLERLLCRTFPNPAELGIELSLPPPDETLTTRQRFARHAESARCSGCHDALDGIGFSFENFDAIGRLRETDADQPVDTRGSVTVDGAPIILDDSGDLAHAIAGSEELAQCAARQMVRFAVGAELPALEDDFVRVTRALPHRERSSIRGLLLAYVEGDWFAFRRNEP